MVKICARSSVTCAGRGPSRAQASLVELRLENLKHDKFYALLLAQRDGLVIVLILIVEHVALDRPQEGAEEYGRRGALCVCVEVCQRSHSDVQAEGTVVQPHERGGNIA